MTPRILVVDDDHGMVRTLCDILRLRGWSPQGVHTGEEAVEAESSGEYHVVLMDIKMPGMNGLQAFKTMKQRSPEVKVVLMTAHTGQDTIAEAEEAGALRVIPKPIDLNSLIELINSARPETLH